MFTTRDVGKQTEHAAKKFLQEQGLILIAENYFCRRGEIDLIMKDNEQLVFVEVKYRRNNLYGSGFDVVTPQKQKKIIHTARHYLYKQGLSEAISSRFDIISISPKNTKDKATSKQPFTIDWLKNAFYYE